MDAVLNDLMGAEFWVLIDDIIVYTNPHKNTLRGWKMSYADLRNQSVVAPRKMCVCSTTGAILRLRCIAERGSGFTRKGVGSQEIPNNQMRQ